MTAEIIWALKTIVSRISYNSNNGTVNCFCPMFPINATKVQFLFGRNTSTCVTNHGLSLYFEKLLTKNVNLPDCFIILFGESFNFLTHPYEMDIIYCYWDIQTQIARVCYWCSEFLGHTTNNYLPNKFEDRTSMLTMTNLKQISMDCLNDCPGSSSSAL